VKRIVTVIIFILSVSTCFSQSWVPFREYEVGKRPVGIYNIDGQSLIILCAGYDANGDGKQDSGDEPASLWYMSYSTFIPLSFEFDTNWIRISEPVKIIDMDFRNEILPLRPGIYYNTMYLPGAKGLYSITIGHESAYKQVILDKIPTAVSVGRSRWNSTMLFLSMKPNNTDPGYVLLYDLDSKSYYDSIPSYPNVQMTLSTGDKLLFVISEGIPGTGTGRLQKVDLSGTAGPKNYYITIDSTIGDIPNHITLTSSYSQFNHVLVTCNGSNEIVDYGVRKYPMIDAGSSPIARETIDNINKATFNVELITSCYDGYLYFMGNKKMNVHGKAEGMFTDGYILAVAIPYQLNSFEPGNTVKIYSLPYDPWHVNDQDNNSIFSTGPNPVQDNLYVKSETNIDRIRIIDVNGELVLESEYKPSIDVSGLPSGVYFVGVQAGQHRGMKKITIVR